IPVVEQATMRVDTRVRVTTFGAEETLTSDLVPLNVNAVLFWCVWDAKAACTEVGNFTRAVELAAQTALRDAIGRAGAAEVATRREQLDRELKKVLEEKVSAWGITILSVEVRDILLPRELQDVMSLEAQAEQRKKGRIILMEAEQDIADMMDEMGHIYEDNDAAMRLRAMHLLYESVRETGGTVVVPSSFSEGFGDVLGDALKAKAAK
ncbi:MAG: slipin family protein, partial [Eggerthellaceae bacterium]|nr:slipin family protein [Eggerthellaceae bacterium]